MIRAAGMLMIGAGGRNSGKTELACALIRRFGARLPLIGVKVTTVAERGGACPRGDGTGCGVCSSLAGDYCLTEETEPNPAKDTGRLLSAGAPRVYWLRAAKDHLATAAAAMLATIGSGTPVICESNSLRTVMEPDIFVLARSGEEESLKASARAVRAFADRVVSHDGRDFNFLMDDMDWMDGQWTLRLDAAAIILAGGRSRRMGRDKALLPIAGRPLLECLATRLRPHFRQIILSAQDPDRYAFLGLETAVDELPDQGPMMGIASALALSRHERNFVIACDIPEIDLRVVRWMLREVEDYDAVVPMGEAGRLEPLFAVYRKSMLDPIRRTLATGGRKVRDVFPMCRIKSMALTAEERLRNINTPEDYAAYEERDKTNPMNDQRQ